MSVDQIVAKLIEPSDAWKLLQTDPAVVLIDVRSDMELTINPSFVANVRKALLGRVSSKSSWVDSRDEGQRGTNPVLLICRSGNRSLDAAELLIKEGFPQISVVSGGFEGPLNDQHHRNTVAGWRFEELPWEQC